MITAAQAAELAEKNKQLIMEDIIREIENGIEKACSEGHRYYLYRKSLSNKVLTVLTEQGYLITCKYDLYEISW